MEEYKQIVVLPASRPTQTPTSWKPPPTDCYKINVDGAMFKEIGQCGIRVVVRNDRGEIMGALSKKLYFPLGALEAEVKAMECGIIFAWELGLRQVIIEGDSQVVIQALECETPAPISIQQVITRAKMWLPTFTSWETSFTWRNNNVAAHLMAKHAKDVIDCMIWVEDTSPIIIPQILSDVLSMGTTHV